jgi:hypothetical protein
MRVVINEAQVERNRKISHILFFVSLAGMGAGFFFTWTQPAESTSISCFILPILLFMTLMSVRMANTWIREPRPVNVLAESLKGLGQKYTIFHYLLPAPHVLIGPEGVFTITTVWQDRAYRVKGKKWYGDNGLLRRLNGFMRQDLIGNPFQDAQFHAQQVQRLVSKIAPDSNVQVQPLVVLIHPRSSVELDDPVFPVLYADPKKRPSLRYYLREIQGAGAPTLTPEDMDELDRVYGLLTRHELEQMGAEAVEDDEITEEDLDDGAYADDAAAQPDSGELGTIYVLQAGQLFHIAKATEPLEDIIASLQDDASDEIELVHTIETPKADAVEGYLHRRYNRKRQKGAWFGLSKKDISWLKSYSGELK